ncbi:MAG: SRPBCC domain-containing protein [Actinomycetota bacterium]
MADTRTVTRERTIAADPDDVWEAITADDGLGAAIDPVPGGRVDGDDPVTGVRRVGAVEHVEVPRDLRYRWWPVDDPDQVSTVDISLTPADEGTTITVTEHLVLAPTFAPRMSAQRPVLLAA